MELISVGARTYYIKNAVNIGVYKVDDTHVFLIDSGGDRDAGKKILKLLEAEGLRVQGIINTHSNADHIGGNKLIQDRTGCKIFADGMEKSFTEFPELEPSFLYGGFPFRELRNKFLLAKPSAAESAAGNLPQGLETFPLPGHFLDMIGVKTSDGVYFLADSLFSEETIAKYHLFFLYDVRAFLNTLDFLDTLRGKLYIPSHCAASEDITALTALNRTKVQEIAASVCAACRTEKTFEEILAYIFQKYDLTMNPNQYVLIGSTVRSYLSYLYEENRIAYRFENNRMLWEQSQKADTAVCR